MALIVNEQATLTDSGTTINGFLVISHDFSGKIRKVGESLILTPQLGCYVSIDKFNNDFQNKLKIEGFPENFHLKFEYDYIPENYNLMYWFDTQLKTALLSAYPNWSEENITITTTPIG